MHEVGTRRGLIDTDLRALLFLAEHPGCTVKAIRDAALVTSGTATVMVDRLQRSGLITRDPNPADRRSSLLTLAPSGQSVVAEIRNALRHVDGVDPLRTVQVLRAVRVSLSRHSGQRD
jgi:DNA-binding MarR family transcriptional regulator